MSWVLHLRGISTTHNYFDMLTCSGSSLDVPLRSTHTKYINPFSTGVLILISLIHTLAVAQIFLHNYNIMSKALQLTKSLSSSKSFTSVFMFLAHFMDKAGVAMF